MGSATAVGTAAGQVGVNGTGNGTNGTANADPGGCAAFEVVEGRFEETLENDTLENLIIRANGERVHIRCQGSGWAIRNVGIVGPIAGGTSAVVNMQTAGREGVGEIHNFYISDTPGNAMFCHPKHEGRIFIQNSTFLNIGEDVLYGSPPGNPDLQWGKRPGRGGMIHVRNCYAQGVTDYCWRLGSDGSTVENCVVADAQVGVANLFAGGEMDRSRADASPGVVIRNTAIVNSTIGLRLGSHQDRIQRYFPYPTVTTIEGVGVDAGQAIQDNLDPVINGAFEEIGGGAVQPPQQAPGNPERAACGIGGGNIEVPVGGGIGFGGPGMIERITAALVTLFLVAVGIVYAVYKALS